MIDLIEKKKRGLEHTSEELLFLTSGIVSGEIPDYQLSAWLMAVCFRGMTDDELSVLTDAMAHSGDMIDLTPLGRKTVDKHSTGGVGDKTTLIVAPLVASLGGIVAKMSGRGLGFTGGTVDKLASIPNFRTELSKDEFFEIAEAHGVCVVGQSGNLASADKKLYALRDVTATVQSIPLIASSIMSKKLAAGARSIVLDVKVGNGAFMKTADTAVCLAEKMLAIGKAAGRNMAAVISDMNVPLGYAIGNSLEVAEAVTVLEGKGPSDLTELCIVLASNMLSLSLGESTESARARCLAALSDGSAKKKLCEMVAAQGGDAAYIETPEKFEKASVLYEVKSKTEGYLCSMDTSQIGMTASLLGAGRTKKDDEIDMAAGIVLAKKTGDFVKCGDTLAVFHTNRPEKLTEAETLFRSAVTFAGKKPKQDSLVYEILRS